LHTTNGGGSSSQPAALAAAVVLPCMASNVFAKAKKNASLSLASPSLSTPTPASLLQQHALAAAAISAKQRFEILLSRTKVIIETKKGNSNWLI